jgi:hypothetical protein
VRKEYLLLPVPMKLLVIQYESGLIDIVKKHFLSLKNKSRVDKYIPHKTPKEIEERVINLQKKHPAWGPERLKLHYDLPTIILDNYLKGYIKSGYHVGSSDTTFSLYT